MKKYYRNLRDHFESVSTFEKDSPAVRRRKVTLVLIAILCSLTGIVTGTYSYLVSQPINTVLIPYTFALVVGLAIILFFVTKRFSMLLYTFLFMILFIPALFQWSIGGLTGEPGSVTIIFWSILAPFGSLMFQSLKKAKWWFSAYIFLIIFSLCIDKYLTGMVVPITHGQFMIDQGINITAISITIFLTMLYFVQAFQHEHARAKKLVIDLSESNAELETTLSELKETQTELVQSAKMASLGRLAAGMAHEINNPIGALTSSADISARCISKMEEYIEKNQTPVVIKENADFQNFFKILKDNSQVFSSASDRIARTMNSFINFARLNGSEFDRIDINESIENTLTIIQQEIKPGTTVEKKYGDIPKIFCYPGELNQVFMSLLTNAAQAIKGEGKITIRTSIKEENLYVAISDNGVGISPEQMKVLFDPRFSRNRMRVKAGFGLFTSYNIVQKHHGKIEVKSDVGRGSTFTVILPLDLDKIIYSRGQE